MSNPVPNPFTQACQPPRQTIPWLILAGGRATRMGGLDKGLVKLGAQPLIMHSMTVLRTQSAAVVINANRNISHYQTMAPCISDQKTGQDVQFDGPLAGIAAGLALLPDEYDWMGFSPCDCPNLPHDLITRLDAAKPAQSPPCWVLCHDGKQSQHGVGLVNRRVLPILQKALAEGERRLAKFQHLTGACYVDFSDTPSSFINLNSTQELSQWQ